MIPSDVGTKRVKGKTGILARFVAPFFKGKEKKQSRYKSPAESAVRSQYGIASAGTVPRSSLSTELRSTAASVVAPCEINPLVDFGYQKNLEERFEVKGWLGKGGNASVKVVQDRETGEEFACKSILKVLKEASVVKAAGHHDSIRREVEVLTRLKGSLNIVKLEAVYEDDEYVHIVMEYCKGGELWHRIGERHYSERTVASYMRAVLRTLAQCHAHHILHRDIKPGNFMLLNDTERSPLKAIDFGLAVPYEPEELPRSDLGMEGTPWYMAPEVLGSKVTPAADIWSAGVMAYQLLTGRFPFDDKKNSVNPSLSAVWRSVLNDTLDLDAPWCSGLSNKAKDFVAYLLQRDPAKRPTAKEALKHPWLAGNSAERSVGTQLCISVVQRIQRFAQSSHLKRGVFEAIAEELLNNPPACTEADRGATSCSLKGSDSRPPLIVGGCQSAAMLHVLRQLSFEGASRVERATVANWFEKIGFKLLPSEVERLLDQLDPERSGWVERVRVVASLMDWRTLQQSYTEQWMALARQAFTNMDNNGDGYITVDQILQTLQGKLQEEELALAVKQVLEEAGQSADVPGIDFNDFLRMLKVGSVDSLDLYDDRMSRSSASLASADFSAHDRSFGRDRSYGRDKSHHSIKSDVSSHADQSFHGTNFNFDSQRSSAASPIQFSFDTGPKTSGSKDNTMNGSGFRFDVGQKTPSGNTPAVTAEVQQREVEVANSIVPAKVTPNLNVGLRGGYCDRRMHGSALYQNALLGGDDRSRRGGLSPLSTVAE